MSILNKIPFFGRRSMSVSKVTPGGSREAEWTDWTVTKAVQEGFKINAWVHRAIHLIAQNASRIPLVVQDIETGELLPEHPLSRVLARPHPQFSRQQLIYLVVTWRELSGSAYLKRVMGGGGSTEELWPVSPDRIAPVPSGNVKDGSLVDAYEIIDEGGQPRKSNDFTPENMVHFRLMDPANPILGIGRLQAAAKAVDLDNSQMGWNLSAMENRGVPDGVLSVKSDLDQPTYNAIVERLKEQMAGSRSARQPIVLGSDAQFLRMSLTPAEMDFVNSRRMNREEIFITLGVPPQLAGSQESMTYNNYASSLRIFYQSTVLPILSDLADTLDNALADELQENQRITYDATNVEALREDDTERSKVALSYWRMGIPVKQISQMMSLDVEEFPGWELPFTGRSTVDPESTNFDGDGSGSSGSDDSSGEGDDGDGADNERARRARRLGWALATPEQRDYVQEQKRRDELAEGPVKDMFMELLERQRQRLDEALEQGKAADFEQLLNEDEDEWLERMNDAATTIAREFAGTVVVGERSFRPWYEKRDELEETTRQRIDLYLQEEQAMLKDLSLIEETTAILVTEQVTDGLSAGRNVQQIREAIEDVGAFSEERALRLSRTLSGTAASIGQLSGAETAGAKEKVWQSAADGEVRDAHVARDGETVKIDERFSLAMGTEAPRYPLDPQIHPGDRINCRCSMTFY